MKGLKLICSFWVAVGFVLFFLDSFPGVSTHAMYRNLPNEASYEVVDVSEEWVREFKSGRYKYAHTVEYSTDDGIKQYTAPLMCKEYTVGFVGTLRYNDSVVVLLEGGGVKDSTPSTVITIGIFVVFILLLFIPSARHAKEG